MSRRQKAESPNAFASGLPGEFASPTNTGTLAEARGRGEKRGRAVAVPIFSAASRVLPLYARALPAARLPGNAIRVLGAILGCVDASGFAWPSRRAIQDRTGIPSARLVSRAIAQLKHANCMETHLISQGQLLPNGRRARHNVQIFQVHLESLDARLKSVDGGADLIDPCPHSQGVTVESGGPLSVRTGVHLIGISPCDLSPPLRSSSPLAAAAGAPPLGGLAPPHPFPARPPNDDAASPPDSFRDRTARASDRASRRERRQDGSPAAETGQEGCGAAERAAVAVLEHWRRELSPGWARFTRRQRETVMARLAEGFGVEELARAVLGAKRSAWNRERPHGFNVGTVFGSADAIQTLAARAPARPALALVAPPQGGGSPPPSQTRLRAGQAQQSASANCEPKATAAGFGSVLAALE